MRMYLVITVGYGNIVPATTADRVYCIVAMLLGAILCDAGMNISTQVMRILSLN